jgi:hypothetical protein
VCAELAKAGHPCPLNAGAQTIVASLATGSAPSGTFNVQATAKTSDGKQIMCTNFHFQINGNNQVSAAAASLCFAMRYIFFRPYSHFLLDCGLHPRSGLAAARPGSRQSPNRVSPSLAVF